MEYKAVKEELSAIHEYSIKTKDDQRRGLYRSDYNILSTWFPKNSQEVDNILNFISKRFHVSKNSIRISTG